MSRVSCLSNENPEKKISKKFEKNFFLKIFRQNFGSPECKDLKKYICGKVIFGVPEIPPLLGDWGAWMTFKKAKMAKSLRNGLSMIETNPLNHNWSDFGI